ncbi:MAG: APC family permease [Anaerolineae bacterium]|nr:APC family permease [Anaerolineae bacterium]
MRKDGLISVPLATAVGLGAIIGAGIFVLSGTSIALAGADALIAFIVVGLVAIILALEMGELSSLMPNVKGASYSYTFKAFGSRLGFITGIFRYLSLAISISVVSLGFGTYLSSILGFSVTTYSIPFAILLIAVLSVVNLLGVKKAAELDSVLVVVKIGILLLFIGFAVYVSMTGVGTGAASHFTFDLSADSMHGIFAASIAIIFAYGGFQSIATFSGRIKGGGKGAAKAILAAVLISITLYVLVVFALLLLLPPTAYKIAADPLTFALTDSGAPSWFFLMIGIGALIATASATLATILTSSRSIYQMSADGLLPKMLMNYNKEKGTAENGVIISAVIGVIMLFTGNIYILVSIVTFSLMFDYLIVGFDVIHFRRMGCKPSFKMPLYPYLPAIGIVILAIFMISLSLEALVFGLAMFVSLVILYHFLSRSKSKNGQFVKLFE